MFTKDTFESTGNAPAARTQTVSEQMFWRIVNGTGELKQMGEALKARGQFKHAPGAAGVNYMRYEFLFNGQTRRFHAQITANTNAVQVKNFLTTCQKRLNGAFDQPDMKAYQPVNRRPF